MYYSPLQIITCHAAHAGTKTKTWQTILV